jgi:hypothetical protein
LGVFFFKLRFIILGVSSIYFALLIDKAELNESTHDVQLATTPEPIIDDTRMVKSTAKIMQRQIISFDSEENIDSKDHLKLSLEKEASPGAYHSDTASSSFEIKNSFPINESPKDVLSRLSEKSILEKNRAGSDSGSHQDSDVSSNNGECKKSIENKIEEGFVDERMSSLELCFPSDDNVMENEENSRANLLMKQYDRNNLLQLKISQMEDDFNERSGRMEQVIYNLNR